MSDHASCLTQPCYYCTSVKCLIFPAGEVSLLAGSQCKIHQPATMLDSIESSINDGMGQRGSDASSNAAGGKEREVGTC